MRLLVYGDVQATEGPERLFDNPSIPLQRYRVELFYSKLKELIRDHRIDALVDLGDTTDDRTAIPIPTINSLMGAHNEILAEYPDLSGFKLVGNHEQWVKSGRIHSGRLYGSFFEVIDKVKVFREGRTSFIFFAYWPDTQALTDAVQEKIRREKARSDRVLVFAHCLVKGALMPSGTADAGVPAEAFDGADLVLIGHVHKPQTVASSIYYVGSPFQQDFGESGEDKRVAVVDTSRRALAPEWIPIEGFPRYHQVSLATFVSSVQEDSEDRYRVRLRNHDEAETFYRHPLHIRAEPEYEFSQQMREEDVQEVIDNTAPVGLDDILRDYLAKVPPQGLDSSITTDDMVEFGKMVVSNFKED